MKHHHHGSQVASENYDKQPLTIKAIYEADMCLSGDMYSNVLCCYGYITISDDKLSLGLMSL